MNKKGFTLIETIVAVALLSVAVAGPLTMAIKSIGTASVSQDQLTAFYLAQEAVEFVKRVRDDNVLSGNSGEDWLEGLNECKSETRTETGVQFSMPFSSGSCTNYCNSIGGSCVVAAVPWNDGVCPYAPWGQNRGGADGADAPWCHTYKSEWGNPGGNNTRCGGWVTAGVNDRNVICACQVNNIITTGEKGCYIDPIMNSVSACPESGCLPLDFHENGYSYIGSDATRFTRTVKVDNSFNGGNEAKVNVEVKWSGRFGEKTLNLQDNIFNWR